MTPDSWYEYAARALERERLASPRKITLRPWVFRNSYEWDCPECGTRVTSIIPAKP